MKYLNPFFNWWAQTFAEEKNGKASGKALSALMAMLLVAFMIVWSVIKNVDVDSATLLMLLGFVCTLYGIKGFYKNKNNNQNPQP